jgi:hypothetical protein
VSENTLEAPPVPETADPEDSSTPAPRTIGAQVRRHVWWLVAAGIVALASVIVVWAQTRPSFDAYGWLVWGYHTIHLNLDLGGAPSWKPLPYLFTVPYALFGGAELWLWMVTAVAISLSGSVFGGRIAYRLVEGADPQRRRAAIVAAIFAGVAVLGLQDYMHYILSVQSDPMIVALCLGAIDNHLCGRHRWAFVLGVLAALGRPEVWPFLGLYTIWTWRAIPSMRWLIVAGVALIAFLWFGIPTITNNRPFVAGQLALNSPRELHSNRLFGTIARFTQLHYLPIWVAALIAVAFAAYRRNRTVLYLGAGCVLWVIVEIAFAFHGWPALPRYLMEPAGLAAVLAGVAVGWVLIEAPRLRAGLPKWAGVPLILVLIGTLVPGAVARVRSERSDLHHERGRKNEIVLLQNAVNALGGYAHIRRCGHPGTVVEFTSVLGWLMKLNIGVVGHSLSAERRQHYPTVLFIPGARGGWTIVPLRIRHHSLAACRSLNARFVKTPQNPAGLLVRR